MQGEATIAELMLVGGRIGARLICARDAVPAPGRYLLGHDPASDAPLATELFLTALHQDGFIAAPPLPREWLPGTNLNVRGPLGRGFSLPPGARRVGLIAFDDDAARLAPLARAALLHEAAVTLVCENPPPELAPQIEVQPVKGLRDVIEWADYTAFDVGRSTLHLLLGPLREGKPARFSGLAEALVRTPLPCGGLAECGVCAVRTKAGDRLACVDGPVFDLETISLEIQ